MMQQYDVIVVGGGGAGMCAAMEVEKAGQRCLLLEADSKLGGATALSTGIFYAAGTQHQRDMGIIDTPDDMFAFIMTLSQGAIRPDLLRITCDRGADNLAFLMDLGVRVPPGYVFGGGRDRVARGHSCNNDGVGIGAILREHVLQRDIEVRLNSRVSRLLVEGRRVVGVAVGDEEYRARSVVITTGGFGNNRDLVKRLWPDMAQHGEHVWCVSGELPFNLRDGLLLAEELGARVIGSGGMPVPTAGFQRSVEGAAAIAPWTIVVNLDGRRFMSETAPYSVSGYLLNAQRESRAYALFDEKSLREVSNDLDFIDPNKQGGRVSSWDEASLRAQTRAGRIKTSGTLAGLAAEAGIAAEPLEATVERYNADVDQGFDGAYFKRAGLHPLREPPFYAVELRAASIGLTCTGLEIDTEARVLNQHNRPIPGLFAAGEVLGDMFGPRYPAGGLSIANAVIFGRIAGENAAKEAALEQCYAAE